MYDTCSLISDKLSHTSNVRWAVYSARLVLEKFESKYPADSRPREAIEAAERWIASPSEKNRDAACAAAYCAAVADPDVKPLILRYGVELLIAEGKEVPDEFIGIEMDIEIERYLTI